jgi:hypothetical protein
MDTCTHSHVQVTAARKRLLCTVCRQPYGACVQCAGGKNCFTAFHPLCARNSGYKMVMELMQVCVCVYVCA